MFKTGSLQGDVVVILYVTFITPFFRMYGVILPFIISILIKIYSENVNY